MHSSRCCAPTASRRTRAPAVPTVSQLLPPTGIPTVTPTVTGAPRSGPSTREQAGLYLHVPFCSAICPYCDFAVQVGQAELRARFVASLRAEIRLWQDKWTDPIDTVYFGGGTPSLLAPDALAEILQEISTHLPLAPNPKLFLEANPEDVDEPAVSAWHRLGFSFVSLGVQSFDDAELKRLGRRHNGEQAREAVAECQRAGFSTVSVDLMFGLPSQAPETWEGNLRTAIELRVKHLSCYQLTVHEGTTFWRWRERGKLQELPEDEQAELYERTHRILGAAGLCAYEVSNFAASPDHQSAHNMKYWRHISYLGLGPSAHSFDGRRRWWNRRGLGAYQQDVAAGHRPIEGTETLARDDLALEALMLGLRTAHGIDLPAFRAQHGIDLIALNADLIETLSREHLVAVTSERLRPTVAGFAVADGLCARFRLKPSPP